MEDHEIPNGWPLGLEVMSMRLRVIDSLPAAALERYSLHTPSASLSSFLSSDLDTESTASFFQDKSVSLGRLIGIRPGERGHLYFTNSIHFEEHGRISRAGSQSDASNMCRGICIPLLVCALMKRSRGKTKARSDCVPHPLIRIGFVRSYTLKSKLFYSLATKTPLKSLHPNPKTLKLKLKKIKIKKKVAKENVVLRSRQVCPPIRRRSNRHALPTLRRHQIQTGASTAPHPKTESEPPLSSHIKKVGRGNKPLHRFVASLSHRHGLCVAHFHALLFLPRLLLDS